jgi:hypothetical protein
VGVRGCHTGRDSEQVEEGAVTVSQLYSLYCAGHAEAWALSDGLLRALEIVVAGSGLAQLERVILQLALLDATNGTPMRSRRSFELAIEQGAKLLRTFGLRLDPSE